MGINIRKQKFPLSWEEIPVIIDLEYVACYILCYTTTTLKKLVKEKGFPAFKVNKFWRIEKEDLRKWIEEQKQITKQNAIKK